MIVPGSFGFLLFCLLGYVFFASVFAYVAMAIDKGRAERDEWRVPEGTLLLLALAGGWPGTKLAQWRLRHKTRSQPFRALLTLIGVVQAVLLCALLVPGTWVQRGVERAVAVVVPAAVWTASGVGNTVSYVVRQAVTAETPLDPEAGEEDAPDLPRRFGPGAETAGQN